MKVMIMAGGTGGHVFPALAVASGLAERGASVVWMGTRAGLEARLVPQAGYPVEWIPVAGVRGKGAMTWLLAPLRLLRALLLAVGALRRQQPAVVLGMGGFVAGPGGLAAWLLRRPLVIHEQNARAGLTNRILSRLATRSLQAFPDALPHAETLGNPVRPEIAALAPPAERLHNRQGALRLLVLGGSQGALALNRTLPQALALLPAGVRPQVWHQAGRTLQQAAKTYGDDTAGVTLVEFIDDMAAAYAWADLVVCRAGALTVAELAAAGVGAILVPFPAAVDDHQTANARYLSERGAALLLPQAELTPQRLAGELQALAGDRPRLLAMAVAARSAAWPDARARIVEQCLEVAA